MSNEMSNDQPPRAGIHRWLRRGLLVWAIVSTGWLANTVRTRGVPDELLASSATVTVADGPAAMEFLPTSASRRAGLIFICGSGVSARAYAPLLRPIAEAGHLVAVVKLPYRFAPLESHKQGAVDRALAVISAHAEVPAWVVAGHSLGGALACRVAQSGPVAVAGMVLVGTTHPKQVDLSLLPIPVTKVYASNDGIAPLDRVLANRELLPEHTKWVEVAGGNHSQFGCYGHQLFDGEAAITREMQQDLTRAAILEVLTGARGKP